MPVRCVVHLEYLKRDVQDITGNTGSGVGREVENEGEVEIMSVSCFELCRFWDLGFVIVLK